MKNNTRENTRRKILRYINNETETTGYMPSLRQIGNAVGLSSPASVKRHVDILEEQGLILTGNNKQLKDGIVSVPILTEKNLIKSEKPVKSGTERLFLPAAKYEKKDLFACRVPDDALSGIGILKDDYVIAEKDTDLNNGDRGVFLVGGNVYIRVFRTDKKGFLLAAENPEFEDIFCTELSLLGKIIAVQRFC